MTKLYDFRDSITGGYAGFIFGAKSDEAAKRYVRICIENKKGLPGLVLDSPQDFALFGIGTYDDETGGLISELRMIAHVQEISDGRKEAL